MLSSMAVTRWGFSITSILPDNLSSKNSSRAFSPLSPNGSTFPRSSASQTSVSPRVFLDSSRESSRRNSDGRAWLRISLVIPARHHSGVFPLSTSLSFSHDPLTFSQTSAAMHRRRDARSRGRTSKNSLLPSKQTLHAALLRKTSSPLLLSTPPSPPPPSPSISAKNSRNLNLSVMEIPSHDSSCKTSPFSPLASSETRANTSPPPSDISAPSASASATSSPISLSQSI